MVLTNLQLIAYILASTILPSFETCKLGYIAIGDENSCKDLICSNSSLTELQSFSNFKPYCGNFVAVELYFEKVNDVDMTFQIVRTFDNIKVQFINSNLESNFNFGVTESAVRRRSSDGPYILKLKIVRSSLARLLEIAETEAEMFLGAFADSVEYSKFEFAPSISSLQVLTSIPSENEKLTMKISLMYVPDFPESGIFWRLADSFLASRFITVDELGFDYYESLLEIPADEVSASYSGTFTVVVWQENSLDEYLADSETVQISIREIPGNFSPFVSSHGYT